MAYETALSPETLSSVNSYLRQLRATGRPVSARDIREAYTAALTAEAKTSLQNRQLAKASEQWQKSYDLSVANSETQKSQFAQNLALQQQYANMASDRNAMMKDAYSSQKSADTLKGLGSLALAYPMLKKGIKSITGDIGSLFNLGGSGPGTAEVGSNAMDLGSNWTNANSVSDALPSFGSSVSEAGSNALDTGIDFSNWPDFGGTASDVADIGISMGDVGDAATSLFDLGGGVSNLMDSFGIGEEGTDVVGSILGSLF